MNATRVASLSLLLLATGCRSDHFTQHGNLRSQGNFRNTWQWHPQGCTRDPFDGMPVGQSRSIATLVWANPGLRNSKLSNPNNSPDAPLRLEMLAPDRLPDKVVVTLHTVDQGGILLDKNSCTKLTLQTQENAPDHAGGRPTLSGQLQLDCRTNESHLTANIKFDRCEY